MIIKNISLKNYRNIIDAEIEFASGINIMLGENANGKTNAVEAAYQFAHGKSFRTKNNAEIINFEHNFSEVNLEFISEKSEKTGKINKMAIRLSRDKLKRLEYNGVLLKKVSEFIGNFRAVLFTPDHLGLVKGNPENRRKFIDTAISQIKPVYLSYISDYERVLIQRNHLLKSIKEKGQTKENLAQFYIWTKKLVRYCAIITRYRGEYIERIKEFAPEFYAGLSSGREDIAFSYISHINSDNGNENDENMENREFSGYGNFEECENLYDKIFAEKNKAELLSGTTLYGVHRDDLHIEIDGRAARGVASQGQQRSAVLALKLAEGNIAKVAHGEYPAFLFDDILSELDKTRQDFILKNLRDRQVIITCCNAELVKDIDAAKTIEVRNGEFYECLL